MLITQAAEGGAHAHDAPAERASSAANATPSTQSSAGVEAKRPYPAPASVPTQEGPKGVRFDFNEGCRVALPESDQPWRVVLSDLDTGNVLFRTEIVAGTVTSFKRYFVRFRVE